MSPERKGYGKVEGKEMADALQNVFPQETQGQREILGQNFLQQDFNLLGSGEKMWIMYLVVRLLDEGFHVVIPSEPPLCLGSAVYFEKRVLTVITWR